MLLHVPLVLCVCVCLCRLGQFVTAKWGSVRHIIPLCTCCPAETHRAAGTGMWRGEVWHHILHNYGECYYVDTTKAFLSRFLSSCRYQPCKLLAEVYRSVYKVRNRLLACKNMELIQTRSSSRERRVCFHYKWYYQNYSLIKNFFSICCVPLLLLMTASMRTGTDFVLKGYLLSLTRTHVVLNPKWFSFFCEHKRRYYEEVHWRATKEKQSKWLFLNTYTKIKRITKKKRKKKVFYLFI